MNPAIKPVFKQLNILFIALFLGLIVFFIAGFVISRGMDYKDLPDFSWMVYAAPLSGMALLVLAYRMYMRKIGEAKKLEKLHMKIVTYRSAAVLRMMLLDFAGVINVMALIATGNILFLLLGVIITGLFLISKPSLHRLIRDLQIDGVEREILEDPNPPRPEEKGKKKS